MEHVELIRIDLCMHADGIHKAQLMQNLYRKNDVWYLLFTALFRWGRSVGVLSSTSTSSEALLKTGEWQALILSTLAPEVGAVTVSDSPGGPWGLEDCCTAVKR
jgi:hypothetical protein